MSEQTTSATPKIPILVLGAGVVGLTTALKLQLQGNYDVLILASILPSDPKSIEYTSQWACFLRVHQTEYYLPGAPDIPTLQSMPDTHLSVAVQLLPEDELIPGAKFGTSFTTITIDTPIYLNYLLSSFLAQGGKVLRGAVQHINQVIEGGGLIFSGGTSIGPSAEPPAAVINCTGMGARFLGGVEDKKIAPWVRFGRTIYKDETGAITYVIPRRSSDVIVGGTRGENDWYPKPREEITDDILRRGLELCPELASPDVRIVRQPTIEDLRHLVVGVGCGLRPAREGGVRLETEWTEGVSSRGRVPIIHNYGHGGSGFQASWGSANVALELLEQALSEL
ncbi:D-amino-acid oxidase [Coprinopsis sp. MPI-PUGE-AT-0042]|nr:D-amino-acid oxidase [Coprinopsis sp. MPI-PUGE-AT-0042]KAH6909388.1 D-amino-acid oxidase [Coprinopsis sp. MPI-PUGE-AT-0042]